MTPTLKISDISAASSSRNDAYFLPSGAKDIPFAQELSSEEVKLKPAKEEKIASEEENIASSTSGSEGDISREKDDIEITNSEEDKEYASQDKIDGIIYAMKKYMPDWVDSPSKFLPGDHSSVQDSVSSAPTVGSQQIQEEMIISEVDPSFSEKSAGTSQKDEASRILQEIETENRSLVGESAPSRTQKLTASAPPEETEPAPGNSATGNSRKSNPSGGEYRLGENATSSDIPYQEGQISNSEEPLETPDPDSGSLNFPKENEQWQSPDASNPGFMRSQAEVESRDVRYSTSRSAWSEKTTPSVGDKSDIFQKDLSANNLKTAALPNELEIKQVEKLVSKENPSWGAITSGEGDILQGKDQEPMKVRTLSIAETLTKTPNKSGKEESINARLETPQLKNTSPVHTTREGELPQGKSNGQEQAQARTISTNEMLKNPETKTGREESITSRVETSQVKIQVEDQRGESSGDNSKSRSDDGKSENRKATVRPFDLRFGTGTNNLESQKQATASPNRLVQINSAVQLGKDAASEDSTPDSAKRITSEEAASKVTLSLGNTRMDSGLNARPVQVQTVFARIASGVEQMKQDQLNSVHLRLTLDSGESVRIHLRMRGQSLRTVILTDSDGLRSAFKEGWESFSRSLLAKGVNADGLQFSMSDKEGGKSSAQDQWEDRDLRNNDLAGLTSTSVAGAPAPKHESPLQLRPIPATESRTRFTRFA